MDAPRRRFSERVGLVRVILQTDGMDTRLRWAIGNLVDSLMPHSWNAPSRRRLAIEEVVVEVLRVLRNAIKEAISAIEGCVKLIEGVRGGGLDKALDAFSK